MPARSLYHVGARLKGVCAASFGAMALLWAAPASAESLMQALTSAYANNPQIYGERARLRATDENLAIAQSGYRPTVNGEFTFTQQNTRTEPGGISTNSNSRMSSLTATERLFDGFQTVNNVYEADANIRAERENLRGVETAVLLASVTAYMDVVRDREILSARDQNVTALAEELRSVKARFDVGEVTRTDVEQARASLASAQSQQALARSNLSGSASRYLLAIGVRPTHLIEPREPVALLPRTQEDAVALASAQRPAVVQAAYLEQAEQKAIRSLIGQLLPSASVTGTLSDTDTPGAAVTDTDVASVTAQVTVPIYEAGSVRAQIRQAKELRQGLLENIQQAREQARNDTSSAWAALVASRAQLANDRVQEEAATIALKGVRAELQVGQRTEIDVLNAVQQLLLAQVAVVSDKHDLIVDAYTVLADAGRLTADQLRLGSPLYDVERHYADTNGKWLDTRVTREEGYAGIEAEPAKK